MQLSPKNDSEISLDDTKKNSFLNNTSIHSYNNMSSKNMSIRVTNGRIFRNGKIEYGDLWIRNGKILDPEEYFYSIVGSTMQYADKVIDAKGLLVSPGFVDIQINGAYGIDFSDPTIKKSDIYKVTRNILSTGCTSICPTIITSDPSTYKTILPLFGPEDGSVENGASILGVHAEGPFIAPTRAGAHPLEYIISPINGESSITTCYGNTDNIRIVTIAPELPGSLDTIKYLQSKNITVSMGHTAAHIDEAIEGTAAGANLITHLFNAMTPFHHRDPGLIGVLGMPDSESPYYSIIVDGIHSHPYAIRFAQKAHGSKCILITDAMAAMGLPDGNYKLGKQNVLVSNNRAVLQENHDTLAGAIVTIDECVRNYRKFTGCSTEEALGDATINPATVINVHHRKGALDANMDADFIFLDDGLNVIATFIGGDLAWSREDFSIF